MKVTIAIDDISLPLPPMRRPDIRERVLTIVLDLLADHGVDDVEIIIATSVHRRMKDWEVRHIVGDKIFNAYWPKKLYNHDAENLANMKYIGSTDMGEEVELNKRAVDSDLVIYVNLNLVPMDGGHKSVSVGLCEQPAALRVEDPTGSSPQGHPTLTGVPCDLSLEKVGTGTVTMTAVSSYTGGTTVQAGTLEVKKMHDGNAVNVNAGTLRVLQSSPDYSSGFPSGDNAFVSRPSALSIAPGATLDLANNDLILDGANRATIEALVKAGFGPNKNWLGTGITSSG